MEKTALLLTALHVTPTLQSAQMTGSPYVFATGHSDFNISTTITRRNHNHYPLHLLFGSLVQNVVRLYGYNSTLI